MTFYEVEEMLRIRTNLYHSQDMQCGICKVDMNTTTTPQLAHGVPQTKRNLQQYGRDFIHSQWNLTLVCGLACNSRAQLKRYQWEDHYKTWQKNES